MIPKPVKEENLGGANFGEETAEEGAAVKLNIEQVRRGIKNTHVGIRNTRERRRVVRN